MPFRFSLELVFVLLVAFSVGNGCAVFGPQRGSVPSGREAAPPSGLAPDTARFRRPSPERQKGPPISNLREAYVEGAYEEVIRRAHDRRRDSLSAGNAVQVKLLLGRAEQARGHHERAIEVLQDARATAFETDRPLVRIDRALADSYAALYRWSLAASAVQRVLETQPSDRAARQALAEVHRQARNWTDAKEQYTHLVRRDSTNGTWWARLAKCEVELGEIGNAISHFSRAHEACHSRRMSLSP